MNCQPYDDAKLEDRIFRQHFRRYVHKARARKLRKRGEYVVRVGKEYYWFMRLSTPVEVTTMHSVTGRSKGPSQQIPRHMLDHLTCKRLFIGGSKVILDSHHPN